MAEINNLLGQLSGGGGGVTIVQDNKDIVIYVQTGLSTAWDVVNSLPPFTISQIESLWVVALNLDTNGIGEPVLVEKVIYKIINKGRGLYGTGGTAFDEEDFFEVNRIVPTADDLEQLTSTVIIDLGEIGLVSVSNEVNSLDPSIFVQDQSEGYVIIRTLVNGEQVDYLFIGDSGTYGLADDQSTDADFQLLTETNIDTLSELEKIAELGKVGHRILGRNQLNYGGIGQDAIDLSFSDSLSSTKGATGNKSFTVNLNTTASGPSSFAANDSTVASGGGSAAFGGSSIASGATSFTSGLFNTSSGSYAFSSGQLNLASAVNSFVGGAYNQANIYAETVFGHYANLTSGNATGITSTDSIFRIGIGTNVDARADGFQVYKDGTIFAPELTNAKITAATDRVLITKEYLEAFSGGTTPILQQVFDEEGGFPVVTFDDYILDISAEHISFTNLTNNSNLAADHLSLTGASSQIMLSNGSIYLSPNGTNGVNINALATGSGTLNIPDLVNTTQVLSTREWALANIGLQEVVNVDNTIVSGTSTATLQADSLSLTSSSTNSEGKLTNLGVEAISNTSQNRIRITSTFIQHTNGAGYMSNATLGTQLVFQPGSISMGILNVPDCAGTTKTIATQEWVQSNATIGSGVDASKIADGSVSNTEFQYINSVTSNVQTQLNTNATNIAANTSSIASVMSGYVKTVAKSTINSSAVTGTTSETLAISILVSANEFANGDFMRIWSTYQKTGTSATTTLRMRIHTLNQISGSTLIGTFTNPGTTTLNASWERHITFQPSSVIEFLNATSNSSYENGAYTAARSTATLNPTASFYVLFTIQNGSAGDSTIISNYLIERH